MAKHSEKTFPEGRETWLSLKIAGGYDGTLYTLLTDVHWIISDGLLWDAPNYSHSMGIYACAAACSEFIRTLVLPSLTSSFSNDTHLVLVWLDRFAPNASVWESFLYFSKCESFFLNALHKEFLKAFCTVYLAVLIEPSAGISEGISCEKQGAYSISDNNM